MNSSANFPACVEWLEGERAFYAGLTAELESKVLTVPAGKIQDLLVNEETANEKYGKK